MVSVANTPNADGIQSQFACVCLNRLHGANVGHKTDASFRRVKSSQQIFQIGVRDGLMGCILDQVAVIDRHITVGSVKLSLDAFRGC